MSSHVLGVGFALLSALLFGGGDFSGGFATRRNRPFAVLARSALAGGAILGGLAWLRGEPVPAVESVLWAAGAGLSGAVGLAALYRALATGQAAVASPISGVVGAALPVAVGAVVEGLPAWTRGLGFALALAGIGLVTRSASGAARASRGQIALSVLSGLGFGGFFLLVAQIGEGAVLAPLAVAKGAALCVAGAVILHGRVRRGAVPFRGRGVVWLSGALDAGANACYLLAAQQTRMDVAVVLSSLYPAVTVLLARAVLAERITRAQWAGVGLCTAAIALIAA